MSKPVRPTFTIVAFRYDQKRSVLYKNTGSLNNLRDYLFEAIMKHNADAISIRRVYEKSPVTQKRTSLKSTS